MAGTPVPRTPADAPDYRFPTRQVLLWAAVLAGIAALIALLVLLGMPVAVAVPTVPTLALLATQVVRNLQGHDDGPGQPIGESVVALAPALHSVPRAEPAIEQVDNGDTNAAA
ncbi:hypothetical protein P3T37_006811 [Kitasatospora sp. MAA4]|uniref:hypothetical protein n=1 Tax=Kitasatospora sp. MAA4 TaxID=3035093 RepID=UPI002473DF08|nr:hypothetical protein [Kitasatospora sp. MAA4]MDH6137379.1 hypothetical protein [Kitasatospora sp. MAA4]